MKINTQNLSAVMSARAGNIGIAQSPLDLLVSWEAIQDLRDSEYNKIEIGRAHV